ncbi:MAG TPA: hypothetical protein PK096_04155 [Candidatus Saccharibacteria bacterium]|nr:hypothetical protein [Candidatus Saccharibacteria bacterium]HRK94535.1 hypothetical protein [Candidatus Saccharibacteria bacterium]
MRYISCSPHGAQSQKRRGATYIVCALRLSSFRIEVVVAGGSAGDPPAAGGGEGEGAAEHHEEGEETVVHPIFFRHAASSGV